MNPRGGRGGYNDFSGGGSAMGSMCNMAQAQSTNSINSGGDGGGDPQAVNGTNLIVNYLPQDMTDRELYALFRTCGPINTCRIMKDYKVCIITTFENIIGICEKEYHRHTHIYIERANFRYNNVKISNMLNQQGIKKILR